MASAEELGVDDVYEVLTITFDLSGDTNKGQFRMLCPVHEMGEEGHSPSCDVDLETGYWNCFSCPAAGDLIDLGVVINDDLPFDYKTAKNNSEERRKWNRGRAKIHRLLQPDTPDAVTLAIKRRLSAARKSMRTKRKKKGAWEPIIPSESSYSRKIPKDLTERGFTRETIRRWNIRYAKRATLMKEDGKSFTLTHAIAIPIYTPRGWLVGWCYRATEKSDEWFRNVRYIYTPGITDQLSQIWFGMHLHQDEKEITVVEGALDAIWCDQNGIPAVAILGSQVKQLPKIRALMDFRKVTLFTDRDLAGATTAHALGEALQERGVPCTICLFLPWMRNRRGERAKDAQDLCPLDIELTHLTAIPFPVWKRSL